MEQAKPKRKYTKRTPTQSEPKLFKLSPELLQRLTEQVAIPVTHKTHPQALAVLEDLTLYGQGFYGHGFGMDPTQRELSDRLCEAVAQYEVRLERTQDKIKNIVKVTDLLGDTLAHAIRMADLELFNRNDLPLGGLEQAKEKLVKIVLQMDRLIEL